jgi:hypothetical protein
LGLGDHCPYEIIYANAKENAMSLATPRCRAERELIAQLDLLAAAILLFGHRQALST